MWLLYIFYQWQNITYLLTYLLGTQKKPKVYCRVYISLVLELLYIKAIIWEKSVERIGQVLIDES